MKAMKFEPGSSDFDKAFVNSMNRQLLKYAAGQHMFCKNCQAVLDWKTTIIFTASKGDRKATVVLCDKCFNPGGVDKLQRDGYETEITSYKPIK